MPLQPPPPKSHSRLLYPVRSARFTTERPPDVRCRPSSYISMTEGSQWGSSPGEPQWTGRNYFSSLTAFPFCQFWARYRWPKLLLTVWASRHEKRPKHRWKLSVLGKERNRAKSQGKLNSPFPHLNLNSPFLRLPSWCTKLYRCVAIKAPNADACVADTICMHDFF